MAHAGAIEPRSFDSALAYGTYQALQQALRQSSEEVLQAIEASGLRGRGGAGFPTGRKWRAVTLETHTPKYVVCNADESEPCVFKDRVLIDTHPHQILEGMAIAAYAVGAQEGVIYIRGEYATQAARLERAIEQAEASGYLGGHILGTSFSLDLHVHRGAGAYICGEETALLESLEGRRGEPRLRPPYPTTHGYHGCPTLVNNVETFAIAPAIVWHGADWYRAIGDPQTPGTKLYTLLGHVNCPGLFEAPYGLTLRQVIEEFGGGMPPGTEFQFALTGGAAGTLVPATLLDLPIDYTSATQGVSLGAGAFLVCDRSVSPLAMLRELLYFFEMESCGKCTPCRIGTVQSRQILDAGYAANDRGETEFEHWVQHYHAQPPARFRYEAHYPIDGDPNPFVWVDLNKCILCTRCVRACAEIQGRFVWGVGRRGAETKIIAGSDTTMLEARCESCSACVTYCPTGALEDKLAIGRGMADRHITTTCPYCGVGCSFDLHVKDGKLLRVIPNPSAPVNGLHLCVKGRYGYDFVHHPDRLTAPLVRPYLLEGGHRRPGEGRDTWVAVDWETALDIVANKLLLIRQASGPDAIGILASAKCTNEENYLMQKLARQVLGTHNVDHCARLCHASTMAGLRTSLGSGAMSNTMHDVVEHAQALFIIGSNTTEQHPVFGSMIRQAVLTRAVKLVVADPRATDITEFAALHLRQRPGTDVVLLNGLMHLILAQGWHDQAFIEARTEGFEAFRQTIDAYPPARVSEITGVAADDLHQAAALLAVHKPMAVIWAMGITQHTTGVLNVLSLANLQLLLGNLGIAGGGVNPLRGQNNVQGACDMGALPDVFPGYQPVTDAAAREHFASAWSLQEANGQPVPGPLFSDRQGRTVVELIHQAGEGSVRALYILGEDPMMTDPDVNAVQRCLEACEFLVLQEIFPSQTMPFADVVLPGTSWAEKRGTFTNTERRIQLVRQAIEPMGDARPDWAITGELARRLLARQGRTPAGPQAGWAYASPAHIMEEIAALTPSYTGVSHARLEHGGSLHWPVPSAAHPGTPILHVDQFPHGRGRFFPCEHLPAAELPDHDYPLYLTTGRVLYHWHGGEMTRRVPGLLAVYPHTLVEISPEDAAQIGLNGRRKVRVTSRRGEVVAEAVVTTRVGPGVVFGNFHFPAEQNVNNLTIAALDPVAKIPEYKVCAVRIEPAL